MATPVCIICQELATKDSCIIDEAGNTKKVFYCNLHRESDVEKMGRLTAILERCTYADARLEEGRNQ